MVALEASRPNVLGGFETTETIQELDIFGNKT